MQIIIVITMGIVVAAVLINTTYALAKRCIQQIKDNRRGL